MEYTQRRLNEREEQEKQEQKQRREDAKWRMMSTLQIEGMVTLPRLFIPAWTWQRDSHVCWLRRNWSPAISKRLVFDGSHVPLEDLLPDFLALVEGRDDAVVSFVQKWGALGITAWPHEVPVPSRVPRSQREPRYASEPIETYRIWARCAQAILNIRGKLAGNQNGAAEDWNRIRLASLWTEAYWEQYATDKNLDTYFEPPRMFSGLDDFLILPPVSSEPDALAEQRSDAQSQLTDQSKAEAITSLIHFLSHWVKIQGVSKYAAKPLIQNVSGKDHLEYENHDDFGLTWELDACLGGHSELFYQGAYQWWSEGGPPTEIRIVLDTNKKDLIARSSMVHLGVQLLAAVAQPVPKCVQCGRFYPALSRKVRDDERMKPLCSGECRRRRENDLQRERARIRRAKSERKQRDN